MNNLLTEFTRRCWCAAFPPLLMKHKFQMFSMYSNLRTKSRTLVIFRVGLIAKFSMNAVYHNSTPYAKTNKIWST